MAKFPYHSPDKLFLYSHHSWVKYFVPISGSKIFQRFIGAYKPWFTWLKFKELQLLFPIQKSANFDVILYNLYITSKRKSAWWRGFFASVLSANGSRCAEMCLSLPLPLHGLFPIYLWERKNRPGPWSLLHVSPCSRFDLVRKGSRLGYSFNRSLAHWFCWCRCYCL